MTYEDAVFILEHIDAHNGLSNEAKEMAIDALKKQIPMKPTHMEYNARDGHPKCPNCGTTGCVSDKVEINKFTLDHWAIWGGHKNKYCSECGQAIDWEGEKR